MLAGARPRPYGRRMEGRSHDGGSVTLWTLLMFPIVLFAGLAAAAARMQRRFASMDASR